MPDRYLWEMQTFSTVSNNMAFIHKFYMQQHWHTTSLKVFQFVLLFILFASLLVYNKLKTTTKNTQPSWIRWVIYLFIYFSNSRHSGPWETKCDPKLLHNLRRGNVSPAALSHFDSWLRGPGGWRPACKAGENTRCFVWIRGMNIWAGILFCFYFIYLFIHFRVSWVRGQLNDHCRLPELWCDNTTFNKRRRNRSGLWFA